MTTTNNTITLGLNADAEFNTDTIGLGLNGETFVPTDSISTFGSSLYEGIAEIYKPRTEDALTVDTMIAMLRAVSASAKLAMNANPLGMEGTRMAAIEGVCDCLASSLETDDRDCVCDDFEAAADYCVQARTYCRYDENSPVPAVNRNPYRAPRGC